MSLHLILINGSLSDSTVITAGIVVFATVLALVLVLGRTMTGWDPPMPSNAAMRSQVLALVRELTAEREATRLVELGSGWGGLSRKLAREFSDAPVSGVEIAFVPWLYATIVAAVAGRRRGIPLTYRRGRIGSETLRDGVIYICYLSGSSMRALRKQFERDQPQNGALISCAFAMPGWTPTAVRDASGLLRTPVYLYRY